MEQSELIVLLKRRMIRAQYAPTILEFQRVKKYDFPCAYWITIPKCENHNTDQSNFSFAGRKGKGKKESIPFPLNNQPIEQILESVSLPAATPQSNHNNRTQKRPNLPAASANRTGQKE
jgi:hypothetical protein